MRDGAARRWSVDREDSSLWLPCYEKVTDDAAPAAYLSSADPAVVDLLAEEGSAKSGMADALRAEIARENLFPFVPILFGAGAAFWFGNTGNFPIGIYALAPILLAASLLAHWLGRRFVCLVLLVPGLLIAGMGAAAIETMRQGTVILDSPVTTMLEGIVERREATGPGRWRYIVSVRSTSEPTLVRAPQRVALTVRTKGSAFGMGDVIKGKVRLSPPSGPALPGGSDFGFSSYFEGIGATGFFYGTPVLADGKARLPDWRTRLLNSLYDLRSTVGDRIRQLVPGDEGAFAAAIVTDERRAISWEVQEALRLAGLAHIVAISGLNMALAAGIFFIGARSILALFPAVSLGLPSKKIAAAGAIVMVTVYYLISGFGVSAERAYIMMLIMLLAVLFDRPSISLHNIALAAMLILIMHPSSVMGASFQMSFGATAALVAGYNFWAARKRQNEDEDGGFKLKGRTWNILAFVWAVLLGTAVTSIIGGVSTAIFSISHFNQLSAYGVVANVATMPLISMVVMPAALVGMLSMPFGLDEPFFTVMGWGLHLVIKVAKEVASWNGDVGTGRGPTGFLPLAVSGLIVLVCFTSRLRLIGIALLASAAVLFIASQQQQKPDLVISEDGRLVALSGAEKTYLNQTRPPDFVFKQWRKALQIDEVISPDVASLTKNLPSGTMGGDTFVQAEGTLSTPRKRREQLSPSQKEEIEETIKNGFAQTEPHKFFCIKTMICLANVAGGIRLAVLEDPRLVGYACDNAALIIAPVGSLNTCRSGVPIINASKLRKTGAVEITFNGSANMNDWSFTPSFTSTQRPWQEHRRYDWRSRGFSHETASSSFASWLNGSGG